jgi:hypothetical protein
MKSLITITSLLFTILCVGQRPQKNEAIYDLTIAFRPATIQLMTDTNSFPSSNINNIGKITYRDIKTGHYKILISGQGQTPVIRDSIIVKKGQQLVLNININGPCLFDHPKNYIPTCPKNHRDSIIPIHYGLITRRGNEFIKDKKAEKVKYGGCLITECDPQFYCKQHEIEF